MFGAFRLILALMVVYGHLIDRELAGPVAVFGFYCLSGYLMTKIVNETYSDGTAGFGRYLLNRILRIWPAYLAALPVSGLALYLWPDAATDLVPSYRLPSDWLSQFTIIGLLPGEPKLIPTAWSLHVELLHYIAIGALLGRSRKVTLLWFIAAIEAPYFVWLWYEQPGVSKWFYMTVTGSSVAFAAGAMIYHFRRSLPALHPSIAAACILIVIAVGVLMPSRFGHAGGIYLALAMAAVTIVALRDLRGRRWDTLLGDLAYPVFLLHLPCAAIAQGLMGTVDALSISAAILLTFAMSWLVIICIDRPVQSLRAVVRRAATSTKLTRNREVSLPG